MGKFREFANLRWKHFWRFTELDRKVELILAGAIVAFAIIQMVNAHYANQASSQQTEQLIAAAKISALAANKNALAAASFADSARKINSGVNDAVIDILPFPKEGDSYRRGLRRFLGGFLLLTAYIAIHFTG